MTVDECRLDPKPKSGADVRSLQMQKEKLRVNNYKTSSEMGHPRIYPCFTHYEVPPLSQNKDTNKSEDIHFKDIAYKTSYNSAYTKKCDCLGASDKSGAPHTLKYTMLFNWANKLKTAPVRKKPECLTEVKDNYRLHLLDETKECSGLLNNLRKHVLCNVVAVGKDSNTKTNSNEKCIQKMLDPYVSTHQQDFIYHTPLEVDRYRDRDNEPPELIIHSKTPVFDESFLRLKFMDRIVRKKILTVPNSGMTTEVRDNYRLPLNELSHKKNLYCSSIVKLPLTKGEVMAIPAMYHTEYNHYGRNWPLSTLI